MKKENLIKAYKVFNSDWTCRDFKYKIGKTYSDPKEPIMCERGFHACQKVADCFNYYRFDPQNKVAEVELWGTVLGGDGDKQCANNITIIKELSWSEMLGIANSGIGNTGHRNSGDRNLGYRNSGDSNSGDRNSGYRNSGNSNSGDSNSGNSNSGDSNSGHSNSGNSNSGNRNSGDSNSGHRNSGNSNSGDSNSGNFNSDTPTKIRCFNKYISREKWDNAQKPDFIYNININTWICFSDMTDAEKTDKPNAYVCDGYLKTIPYKEAWKVAFESAAKEDIVLLKALPGFDAKVFFDITGIQL